MRCPITASLVASLVLAAGAAGCTSREPENPKGDPAVHVEGNIEDTVTQSCADHAGVAHFALSIRDAGNASAPDYWLVLCEDGTVNRVEV